MDGMQKQSSCGLLSLPPELRRQIYSYILPYARMSWEDLMAEWNREHVSILGTNKQVYLEAIALLYGQSTFLLEVRYWSVHWVYRTFTSSDDFDGTVKHLPTDDTCPKAITAKNISRIRRVCVVVWPPHTDDKGKRLAIFNNTSYANTYDNAMEGQISALLAVLKQMKEIQDLDLWLHSHQRHEGYARRLLSPLMSLENVRNITLDGDISSEFAQEIKDHFRNFAAKSGD